MRIVVHSENSANDLWQDLQRTPESTRNLSTTMNWQNQKMARTVLGGSDMFDYLLGYHTCRLRTQSYAYQCKRLIYLTFGSAWYEQKCNDRTINRGRRYTKRKLGTIHRLKELTRYAPNQYQYFHKLTEKMKSQSETMHEPPWFDKSRRFNTHHINQSVFDREVGAEMQATL